MARASRPLFTTGAAPVVAVRADPGARVIGHGPTGGDLGGGRYDGWVARPEDPHPSPVTSAVGLSDLASLVAPDPSAAPAPPVLRGPFHFEEPWIDGATVGLRYRIGADVAFTERVELPVELPDTEAVATAVRVLHLVAGVSYYKCVAPVPLMVPALSDPERRLVEALYDEGLREFAYRNQIPIPLPVELVEAAGSSSGPRPESSPGPRRGLAGVNGGGGACAPGVSGGGDVASHAAEVERTALVPIGGGKDSALVAAMVPGATLFAVNPVGAQVHLADSLGRDLVGARRTLDPRLRELVAEGVPNGHIPVTAITSAVSVLVAVALGCDDVLMGIERSADEPSLITAEGTPVNHQFSKSQRAELLLRDVFVPTGVRYLSLLRPLTELAIGAAVARRGLAADIVSCNRVFTVWNENTSSRQQRPCGECAKCLFTSLMVAPSSSPDEVAEHYGRALLDDPAHIGVVRDFWSEEKPFDCVGERLESAAAVALLAITEGWRDQVVVRELASEAEAFLAAAGAVPADYLTVGDVGALPVEYRDVVRALAPDLASVPGLVGSPGSPGSPGSERG